MSDDNNDGMSSAAAQKGLRETNQKVEASLLTAIEEHVQNNSSKAGVDFLDVKNSLLLSYLIDLTLYLKAKLTGKTPGTATMKRLLEMKVVLDKLRGLDKKLRYQIDKLLQAETASTYVTEVHAQPKASQQPEDDPLQYRPDPKAFDDDDDDDDSSQNAGNANRSYGDDDDDQSGEDDDELEAAKRTIAISKSNKKVNKKGDDGGEDNDGVYRAPRHTAMPYLLDKEDKEATREKRERRRMRISELASSLRHEYGDAPEQEDYHGGTAAFGKQAVAAKKFAKFQEEKTKFEEDYMMRLTTTRKEKKERKQLIRNQGSNLNGIADLGNLAREASRVIGDHGGDNDDSDRGRPNSGSIRSERHANGKRRKEQLDQDGRPMKASKKKGQIKNAYQAALFGGGNSGGTSKKKKKSRH
jgi:U3 small nucleolar ribonucleoprotein protein LCP5